MKVKSSDIEETLARKKIDVHIGIDTSNFTQKQKDILRNIEIEFSELGIRFDTGGYCEGGQRDWEWDYSLEGPIKICYGGIKKIKRGKK